MEKLRSRLVKSNMGLSLPSFMNFRRLLSNLLIGGSLFLLLVVYLPIVRTYLPASSTPSDPNFSIVIPKINASAPLIDNVDPWNETEYREALGRGVAIAKGFAKPGEDGATFIFAHSSDSPWRITSYNTVFFRLGELKSGDLVEVNYGGERHKYAVSYILEVWPDEVDAITKQQGNKLILQTCTPVGTSLKRLLVFAVPLENESLQQMREAF